MKKILCSLLLIIFSIYQLCAQTKIEFETKIKEGKVNSEASSLINKIFPDIKKKWYYEENESGEFYECKFKKTAYYSIKFNLDGSIVDIEILKKEDYLPVEITKSIENVFSDDSTVNKGFRISKIQEQWTGEQKSLIQALELKKFVQGLDLLVEIELTYKSDGDIFLEEWVLNQAGDLISRRKILKPKLDNLIY